MDAAEFSPYSQLKRREISHNPWLNVSMYCIL